MTMTTEAMKQAQHLLRWTQFGECRAYSGPVPEAREVDKLLTEAIAAEEAQGVKPLFWYRPCRDDGGYEGPVHNKSCLGKMLRDEKPGEWKPLFTLSAPPANTELLAGKLELMTAERDKLLLELGDLRALRALPPSEKTVLSCRNCAGFGWEPTVYSGRIPCSHCSTAPLVVNQSEAVVNDNAQPMTDQELDDLLPTNDSMSRKDSQRWIARATERHHKIGVKP